MSAAADGAVDAAKLDELSTALKALFLRVEELLIERYPEHGARVLLSSGAALSFRRFGQKGHKLIIERPPDMVHPVQDAPRWLRIEAAHALPRLIGELNKVLVNAQSLAHACREVGEIIALLQGDR